VSSHLPTIFIHPTPVILFSLCLSLPQACLDHTFKGQRASCLVNPRAGYETELHLPPTTQKKRVAVVRWLIIVELSPCICAYRVICQDDCCMHT
jgi:hypothetical protein